MNRDNNMETVSEMNNQTNDRLYDRNIPSSVLQPYFLSSSDTDKVYKTYDY